MDPKQHEKIAVNVSTVTIIINLVLAGFKFVAGFVAHSGAMISDAVHSASDVLATFIVILGVKLAGRYRRPESGGPCPPAVRQVL